MNRLSQYAKQPKGRAEHAKVALALSASLAERALVANFACLLVLRARKTGFEKLSDRVSETQCAELGRHAIDRNRPCLYM